MKEKECKYLLSGFLKTVDREMGGATIAQLTVHQHIYNMLYEKLEKNVIKNWKTNDKPSDPVFSKEFKRVEDFKSFK